MQGLGDDEKVIGSERDIHHVHRNSARYLQAIGYLNSRPYQKAVYTVQYAKLPRIHNHNPCPTSHLRRTRGINHLHGIAAVLPRRPGILPYPALAITNFALVLNSNAATAAAGLKNIVRETTLQLVCMTYPRAQRERENTWIGSN